MPNNHLDSSVSIEEFAKYAYAILESLPDMVGISGSNFKYKYVNESWIKSTGSDVELWLGQYRDVHEDLSTRDTAEIRRGVVSSGKRWHSIRDVRWQDGSRHQEETTITPLFKDDGSIDGYFGVVRDVTEELELKRQLTDSKSRNEVTSALLHELTSSLTAYFTTSDFINRTVDIPEDLAERVNSARSRAVETLAEASEMVNFRTPGFWLQKSPTDVRVLLDDVIEDYAARLKVRNISVIVSEVPTNAEKTHDVDSKRIREVFDNLLSNAEKYALPDSSLHVSLEHNQGSVSISFRNRTIAQREEKGADLINWGSRGLKSAESGMPGYGIGLSLVRSILEAHDGHLEVSFGDDSLFVAEIFIPG